MNLRRGREDDRHRRYLKIKKIKKGLEIYPMGVYNKHWIRKTVSVWQMNYGRPFLPWQMDIRMKDGSAAGDG